MLFHGVIRNSVEAAIPFAPDYGKQDLFSKWKPEKAWRSCTGQGEFSLHNSSPLIADDPYAVPGSDVATKRRKLPKKFATMLTIESRADKAPTSTVVDLDPPRTNVEYDIDDSVRDCTTPAVTSDHDCLYNIGSESLSTISDKELIRNGVTETKLETGGDSVSTRMNVSNIAGCSNTELAVLGDDLSIRELCASVLRSHVLLTGDCPADNFATVEVLGNIMNDNFFQSCELCGNFESTANMLLCDHCEEAFHVSCCNLKEEMLPADLWFCQSCSKLNRNNSPETSFLKPCSISWWNEKSKLGRIAAMLKHPEPYTSRVRIGSSYQAVVPEWSDQLCMDFDCISEPLEMDPSQTACLHECSQAMSSNTKSVSNWLQCREVLHDDGREGSKGTVCGKWRRAPFSEFQADDWDCSCAVIWDPSRADCAVPQELDTDEVLRQLKYVEQLKSQLLSRKRRNS